MLAISLTVMNGNLKGQEFVLEGPGEFVIGRAADCDVQLASGDPFQFISRHHCQLKIDPPASRLRDLGSLHGTWVNRRKIGQRQPQQSPVEAVSSALAEWEVAEGDEIVLGGTLLRVCILDLNRDDQYQVTETALAGGR